jgi:hypothetical protein
MMKAVIFMMRGVYLEYLGGRITLTLFTMKSMRRCGFEFIGSVWVRLDDCGGSKPL